MSLDYNNIINVAEKAKTIKIFKNTGGKMILKSDIKSHLCISKFINKNYLEKEKVEYKNLFWGCINSFVVKYRPNEVLYQMFKEYSSSVGNVLSNKGNLDSFENALKKVLKTKFRWFEFYSNRFLFLFIVFSFCAFKDKHRARVILREIDLITKNKFSKELEEIYNVLYAEGTLSDKDQKYQEVMDKFRQNIYFFDKKLNKIFIAGNMSSGKSTLINTIIGKKISKTQNDTCTAKIHFIYNKAFEDKFNYEWDGFLNLNADQDALMNDDEKNTTLQIGVATNFKIISEGKKRVCLIDSPGVNSALNTDHKQMTMENMQSETFNSFLYVLNAENIGTNDDRIFLKNVSENVDHNKIYFVINKLDKFKSGEDSVESTLNTIKEELIKVGFESPIVFPISAYAGYLGKKIILGEELDEDKKDEVMLLNKKLKKEENRLSKFAPIEYDNGKEIEKLTRQYPSVDVAGIELFVNSGFQILEEIILNGE